MTENSAWRIQHLLMAMTDTTCHVFLMPCLQLPSCSLVALSAFFFLSWLSVGSREKSVDPSSSRRRSSVTAGSVHTTLLEYFNTGMLVCLKLYSVAITDIATQSYRHTHRLCVEKKNVFV